MISYENYPILFCLSDKKELNHLPKPRVSNQSNANTDGYEELKYNIKRLYGKVNPSSFWLTLKRQYLFDSNVEFRKEHIHNFIKSRPQIAKIGVILSRNNMQYLYLYMPKKTFRNVESDYLGISIFRNNLFLGFEGATLTSDIELTPNGIYEDGISRGGYIEFAVAMLSFFSGKLLRVLPGFNSTGQAIFTRH